MHILTAAEYIKYRQQNRPEGISLAEFIEAYPTNHLISEWRDALWQMFIDAERDGERVRPAVLRSMEQHMGDVEAYKFATQLAKHRRSVFSQAWWRHMKEWRRQADISMSPYKMLRAGYANR